MPTEDLAEFDKKKDDNFHLPILGTVIPFRVE
jgi:hypothetical protein